MKANTNNIRNDFEATASVLIEVDPYSHSNKTGGNTRTATNQAVVIHELTCAGILVKILRNFLIIRKMSLKTG